jgi:hypothetical protein
MNAVNPKIKFLHGAALCDAIGLERRRINRQPINIIGRLAYGGLTPGILGCQILDLSETGTRVETYSTLDSVPEFMSIEFSDIYCRVRRRWTNAKQIGLEFIFDEA